MATKTTVTGTITDGSGVVATSGYVDFFIQPDNIGVLYYVVGTGIIAPQQSRAFISPTGTLVAADLVSAFQMWGKSTLSPGNLNFRADLYPNGQFTNSVANLAIDGATFDLSNPTFSPTLSPNPQSVVVITTPIQQNLIPGVDNTFNLGSAIARYAAGFFVNLFVFAATITNLTITTLTALGNLILSGFISLLEIVAPAGVAGRSLLWDDSTSHRLKMNNNNAGADSVVGAATLDNLTNKTMVGVSTGNNISLLSFQKDLAPVTGNGADQTFFTFTIPANTINVNKGIKVTAAWKHSTGVANIIYHMNCGGVLLSNYGSIADAAASLYSLQFVIFNIGGGLAMKSDQFLNNNNTGSMSGGTSWGTGLAVDFSLAKTLTLSFNVAATDAVTPQMFLIESIQ